MNVIRNTDPVKAPSFFPTPAPKRSTISPVHRIFTKLLSQVGVDISGDCIRLVKTEARFGKKPVILDFRSIPLAPGICEDRNRMTDLLRTHLADFCADTPRPAIWTSAPQDETDIRCLRIPKVSSGKLENVVYWTYQKEAPFEKDRTILDFQVLGDVVDNGIAKTEVLVSTASRDSIENLTAMFKAAGYGLTGVVAPSFAVQNYFKTGWVDRGETLCCSLLIDFNWSRIDIFRPGGHLIVSRGIKAGIASMIESIKSEAARTTGGIPAPGLDDGQQVLDLPAFDTEEADQALEMLSSDATIPSSAVSGHLKDDDVFDMVLPALERLVRQVERTLEHVSLRFSDGPIGNLLMSGPITAYPRLVNHVANQLGLSLATMDPFAAAADGLDAPRRTGERAAYVSSAGLALSGGEHTPNFLLTRQEAGVKRRGTRLNQAVLVLFILGLAALWGVHHVLKNQLGGLEARIGALAPADAISTGEDDRNALLAMAGRANSSHLVQKAYAAKCLPVAMIGEITLLAPQHIRFIRFEGGERFDAAGSKTLEKDAGTNIRVEAVAFGPAGIAETRLAQYLLALKRSPLFSRATLKQRTFERLDSQDVLRFTLELEGA